MLGLVRAGVQVLDPGDTANKLEAHPELQHCDASPCLKAIGQLLDVGYVVRVKFEVAGNSYKSVARLFTTEGAAPAALPIATESKSCDVCTVAEARARCCDWRTPSAPTSRKPCRSGPGGAAAARAGAAPGRSRGDGDDRRARRRRRRAVLASRRAAPRPTATRTARATSAAASSSAPARR